jgi:hypothetical protein
MTGESFDSSLYTLKLFYKASFSLLNKHPLFFFLAHQFISARENRVLHWQCHKCSGKPSHVGGEREKSPADP